MDPVRFRNQVKTAVSLSCIITCFVWSAINLLTLCIRYFSNYWLKMKWYKKMNSCLENSTIKLDSTSVLGKNRLKLVVEHLSQDFVLFSDIGTVNILVTKTLKNLLIVSKPPTNCVFEVYYEPKIISPDFVESNTHTVMNVVTDVISGFWILLYPVSNMFLFEYDIRLNTMNYKWLIGLSMCLHNRKSRWTKMECPAFLSYSFGL